MDGVFGVYHTPAGPVFGRLRFVQVTAPVEPLQQAPVRPANPGARMKPVEGRKRVVGVGGMGEGGGGWGAGEGGG
jgi:hypothetical protein